jgi:hypothetical protein
MVSKISLLNKYTIASMSFIKRKEFSNSSKSINHKNHSSDSYPAHNGRGTTLRGYENMRVRTISTLKIQEPNGNPVYNYRFFFHQ